MSLVHVSLVHFLIVLHNSNTCFSYMQAAEKAKYIGVFNSPSSRKCSTTDITVKENPNSGKGGEGKNLSLPSNFFSKL